MSSLHDPSAARPAHGPHGREIGATCAGAADDPDAAARAFVESVAARSLRLVSEHEGARTVWRRWGERGGVPLVLLHGGHGSWSHWIRNVEPLAVGRTVLAVDMPGYGESDELAVPVTPPAMAAALSAGIRQLLGADAMVDLVGFSFGSVVAGHWAHAEPHQVRRLVLVGAAGLGLPRVARGSMMSWRRIVDARERRALHRHNLATLMLHDAGRIDDLAIHLQTANSAAARVRSRDLSLGDSLARLLPGVAVPVTGIWGAEDVTARPDLPARGRLLRHAQPLATFCTIVHAGHWVQYEDSEGFHHALLGHLPGP